MKITRYVALVGAVRGGARIGAPREDTAVAVADRGWSEEQRAIKEATRIFLERHPQEKEVLLLGTW